MTSLVPFLFFIPVWLPAWVVLGSWFVLQWLYFQGAATAEGAGVAYLAHVVGFAAGVVLIILFGGLRARRRPATRPPPAWYYEPRYELADEEPAGRRARAAGPEAEAGQERLGGRVGAATRARPAARASTQAATTSRVPTSRPRQASSTTGPSSSPSVPAGRSAAAPTTRSASTATSHRRSPAPGGPEQPGGGGLLGRGGRADDRAGRVEQPADVGQEMVGRGGQVGQVGQPGDAAEDQRGRPAEPVGAVQVGVGPVADHQVGAGADGRRGLLEQGPLGLARDLGPHAGGRPQQGQGRPGARPDPLGGREGRVRVAADEPGPGPDGQGGVPDPGVGQVRVEADRHHLGLAPRRPVDHAAPRPPPAPAAARGRPPP